ncbi:Di-copper centre-containing protein [Aspergillus steynii IBT 23096]|uniref:tyrosinase n=1 Tax=Aspergillus steynii IBT 23096 TaxID=1392250 RepID=A0A2I2G6A8_9EURO|nr:Di-copper centre-containing protein [Aspergillus steynii IBT 23096]PLB48393.1 Di-copper centre-containing protein [Aspergillus steynii IBT 23096]
MTTKEQSEKPSYAITGIPIKGDGGKVPVRKDIDIWYEEQAAGNRIQLTLFLEALTLMQRRGLDDKLSYFRLAGIHAAPGGEWDNVDPAPTNSGKKQGFCVHNHYTFPTWHRVYMTLFEQATYEAMIEFINTEGNVPLTERDTWKKEAGQWRLPYWDFARFPDQPQTGGRENENRKLRLPKLVTESNVEIERMDATKSKMERTSVPNPVHRYASPVPMGKLDGKYAIDEEKIYEGNPPDQKLKFTYPWDKCVSTTKYGLMDDNKPAAWEDAGQHWEKSNLALNEHAWSQNARLGDYPPTLQEMTFRLLKSHIKDWGSFATTRFNPRGDREDGGKEDGAKDPLSTKPNTWLSLESIHNNIHNWVGGSQFQLPRNGDTRFWGAGHMSSVQMAAFDPLFWVYHCNIDRLAAIWQDLNPRKWFDDDDSKGFLGKELRPFSRKEGEEIIFYKSSDTQNWTDLNYDYEITQQNKLTGPGERKPIEKAVESLYGQGVRNIYDKLVPKDERLEDYVLSVEYDRYALKGEAFKINTFFDEVLRDECQVPDSKGFVGSTYNFSASVEAGNCSNCREQMEEGIKCIAEIPATIPVYAYRAVHGDNPKAIKYVVLNCLGEPAKVPANITLRKLEVPFYEAPSRGTIPHYEEVSHGEPAMNVFD